VYKDENREERNCMNKEIELHDSSINEVKRDGKNIIIFLEAIIHHSDGRPGIDNGTCCLQNIEMHFLNAELNKLPDTLPIEISDGYLLIDDDKYINMFEFLSNISGEIEFKLITGFNETLQLKSNSLQITSSGNEEYLQDFTGIEK
jgi:hypothetical protein